jgi:hypothetical protein
MTQTGIRHTSLLQLTTNHVNTHNNIRTNAGGSSSREREVLCYIVNDYVVKSDTQQFVVEYDVSAHSE